MSDPKQPRDMPAGVSLAVAAILPTIFFLVLPPLSKSGLWDPYELNVADLARRLALNLFHDEFARARRRRQLDAAPERSRAARAAVHVDGARLQLFGLHEWAGRCRSRCGASRGVVATYGFVARLVDRRAGLFSALALATMPLFFVQARTMLGDVVTMTSARGRVRRSPRRRVRSRPKTARRSRARASRGSARRRSGSSPASRPAAGSSASPCRALASASRGASRGPPAPAKRQRVRRRRRRARRSSPARAFSYWGVNAHDAKPGRRSVVAAGAMMKAPRKYPTFDAVIGQLGPALAPWSAFAPFAFGRLFLAPRRAHRARRSSARASRASALRRRRGVAFAAHGCLAAKTDLDSRSARPRSSPRRAASPSAIYERGAHPSVAVGVGTARPPRRLSTTTSTRSPRRRTRPSAVAARRSPRASKTRAPAVDRRARRLRAPRLLLGRRATSRREENDATKPFDPARYLSVDRFAPRMRGTACSRWRTSRSSLARRSRASRSGSAWLKMTWLRAVSLQVRDGCSNAWWVDRVRAARRRSSACSSRATSGSGRSMVARARSRRPRSRAASSRSKSSSSASAPATRKTQKRKRTVGSSPRPCSSRYGARAPGSRRRRTSSRTAQRPIARRARHSVRRRALPRARLLRRSARRQPRGGLLRSRRRVPGVVLCFSYYPALANQLSPKEVFESYQHVHKGGEPLALLGVGGRTAAYYAGGQAETFTDTQRAFAWLTSAKRNSRRFLAMRAEELPKLNQLYREQARDRRAARRTCRCSTRARARSSSSARRFARARRTRTRSRRFSSPRRRSRSTSST